MELRIREAIPADAAAITDLSHQLGYPLSEDQVLKNINAVLSDKDHNAFVATHENKVIGWIGVAHIIMIEITAHCEINGLVIDQQYRGKGVGKLLIEKAKEWGKQKGNAILRVRCNVKRKQTHLFYEHLGFTETKEQKNFEIPI